MMHHWDVSSLSDLKADRNHKGRGASSNTRFSNYVVHIAWNYLCALAQRNLCLVENQLQLNSQDC